jgi:prepilin peptidase CpaA
MASMQLQVQHIVVCGFAAAAAIYDVRTGSIPNRLVLVGLATVVCAELIAGAVNRSMPALTAMLTVSGFGFVICGLIPLVIWMCRGIGGGDVKLLALCGAGLGPVIGLEAELYAFGVGAMYALGLAAYKGTLFNALRGSAALLINPLFPRRFKQDVAPSALQSLRFAPAIAIGVVAALALHGRVS